jgi:uroporphyrinogen decarboxylase
MRQAGRYLPEYRTLRERHSFLEMCHHPELAAEVTLLPIRIFEMDAAILFSDILVIAEALGRGLHFEEGIGPIIERPLHTKSDVDTLSTPHIPEALGYVERAIHHILPTLHVPLIGFCGAPFTVASYLIEGKSSRDLKKTKQWMLRDPESFHVLLQKICTCTLEYLKLQIKAGVHALQIFDSWVHVLSHTQFLEFSLKYLRQIVETLRPFNIPLILFCKGSSVFAPQMGELSPAGISLDWNADIAQMRAKIPSHIALQGNLDPDVLYGNRKTIKETARALLKSMQGDPGYIFNLGHGIHPDTPVDAVRTLVDLVKEI